MQFGYHTRLSRESRCWVEKGIIDPETAEQILTESRSQKRGYSFSSIIIMLGIISLCFAAMTFVAANWDEMPKIARVAILLTGMGLSYLAAHISNQRAMPIFTDAFVLLGCGIFGASIMLVGQMYHLQGRAEDAVLLWAAGSLLAAFVLRASTALWLAIALFTLWMNFDLFGFNYMFGFNSRGDEINYLYLAFWLICAALAWWLHSRMSAHFLIIGMMIWVYVSAIILTERYDTTAHFYALYSLWFVGIALAITSHDQGQYLRGVEATVIRYLVLLIIGMTAVWLVAVGLVPSSFFFYFFDDAFFQTGYMMPMIAMLAVALVVLANAVTRKLASVYDIAFCAVWIAAAILVISPFGLSIPYPEEAFSLALSIWLIRMGDRQDIPAVTRLGYLAFALIMLLVYFRTASSLLGTTGFYLTAGILMVVGAIFLPKLFKAKTEKEAA